MRPDEHTDDDDEQINADVEAMLKAASNEVHDRPRIKAITEPINRRH